MEVKRTMIPPVAMPGVRYPGIKKIDSEVQGFVALAITRLKNQNPNATVIAEVALEGTAKVYDEAFRFALKISCSITEAGKPISAGSSGALACSFGLGRGALTFPNGVVTAYVCSGNGEVSFGLVTSFLPVELQTSGIVRPAN